MKYSLMICIEVEAQERVDANYILEEIVELVTAHSNVQEVYSTDVSEFKLNS